MFSRRDVWIGVALVVAIVSVYLGSLALAPSGAEFAGTDATAADFAGGAQHGPLLSLSPELESGLFA
ncbi:MAG TPA: hypothetical protein VLQ67_04420, partial [Arachnia sp.]|nr:hypothetical protein [Arachnia sp.]